MKPNPRALIKALILLPGNALIVIPGILMYLEGGIAPGWGHDWMTFSGGVLSVLGVSLAVHTVRLFFTYGEGTPAPWEPPRKLVVRGAYRYMRNPMITSVLCILAGESLLFGSVYILAWAAFFFIANNFYFALVEEPALERRFGEEYLRYKRAVPRWLPKIKPHQ